MTKLSDSQSIPAIRTKPLKRERRVGQLVMFNVVVPLLLLAVGIFVLTRLGTVQPATRPASDMTRLGRLKALPPVRVVKLQSLEATGKQLRLQVDGTVVPYRESRVAAEVAGRVVFKSNDCEAGNYVTKGQLLMKLDATDYEIEVQRLSQLRDQEYQSLSEVDQEMANAKRLIEVAKQDVDLQQREVDRQGALPRGFASRAEIDQANRTLLAARQQLVSSENQLDLLKKRRLRLETSERLAATQLKQAEINLKRTEIVAPIDGVIVNEDADLNTFVARGNLLVTIEDTSKVEVATSLRMDQLYWVLNQNAKMPNDLSRGYELPETPAIIEYEMSGRDGLVYRWKGRLLRFNGIGVDSTTRTVPVRVVVDRPTEYVDEFGQAASQAAGTALVRGMFVSVKLLIKPRADLVAIPARALQPGNRVFQFVPDDSVLEVGAADKKTDDTNTEAQTPESANESENFDPTGWDAGRVIVRSDIYPIDSLSVESTVDQVGSNRVWVCEVRDRSLQQGSYVVISPVGNVDDQGMPARATQQDESFNTVLPERSSELSKPTVARNDPNAKGA